MIQSSVSSSNGSASPLSSNGSSASSLALGILKAVSSLFEGTRGEHSLLSSLVEDTLGENDLVSSLVAGILGEHCLPSSILGEYLVLSSERQLSGPMSILTLASWSLSKQAAKVQRRFFSVSGVMTKPTSRSVSA